MTFLLSNIFPKSYFSGITFEKTPLLYCIMRGYIMNIAYIIIKEIFKIAISQPTIRRIIKLLSFPSLITRLCKMQGVLVTTQGRSYGSQLLKLISRPIAQMPWIIWRSPVPGP